VRRWRDAVFLIAGLLVIAFLCWSLGVSDVRAAFSNMRPVYLILYLSFAAAVPFGCGVRWHYLASQVSISPPLKRFVTARLAGDAVGSLVPSGRIAGDPVRIALIQRAGITGARAGAGVAIDRLVELITNTIVGATYVSIFVLARAAGSERQRGFGCVAILLLLFGALLAPILTWHRGVVLLGRLRRLSLPRFPRFTHAIRVAASTEEHLMTFFHDHPIRFILSVVGSLLIEGFSIAAYYCLLEGFSLRVDVPTLLLALVATGVAQTVPSPAGIGALEAGQVAVWGLAAGDARFGLLAGLAMRVHETLWVGIGLAVLFAEGLSVAWLRQKSQLLLDARHRVALVDPDDS
jgi:uncharacterized membrane protein YbhN (UPF0104 family)